MDEELRALQIQRDAAQARLDNVSRRLEAEEVAKKLAEEVTKRLVEEAAKRPEGRNFLGRKAVVHYMN